MTAEDQAPIYEMILAGHQDAALPKQHSCRCIEIIEGTVELVDSAGALCVSPVGVPNCLSIGSLEVW